MPAASPAVVLVSMRTTPLRLVGGRVGLVAGLAAGAAALLLVRGAVPEAAAGAVLAEVGRLAGAVALAAGVGCCGCWGAAAAGLSATVGRRRGRGPS